MRLVDTVCSCRPYLGSDESDLEAVVYSLDYIKFFWLHKYSIQNIGYEA